ncbi:MAG: acylphosphatase [Chloroflexota bacterium]
MTDDQASRVEVVVRGQVQGVGFRMFAGASARSRGLVGWVANEHDGSVRAVAEGPRAALEAWVAELAAGSPGAIVDGVEHSWSTARGGLDRFAIRSGWHGGD